MAILASTRHGLNGWNWTTRFNYEWVTRLGVHRLGGTVKPTDTPAAAEEGWLQVRPPPPEGAAPDG